MDRDTILTLLRKAATFEQKMDSYADYQVYYNVVHKARERIEQMGADAVEALIEALADDDYRVRGLAASLLGKIGDARANAVLWEALAREDQEDARRAIRNALSRLRDERHIAQLVRELSSADPAVRAEAVRLLSKTNEDALIPHILDALDDPEPLVRNAALSALGYNRDQKIAHITHILERLHDEDATVRLTAVTMLARSMLKDTRIFEGILRATDDPDPAVRRAALRALSDFNDERAIDAYLDHIEDPDLNVREAAMRGLHEVSPPQALQPLIDFVGRYVMQDDQGWFWLVAATLGELGDPAAIPALIQMLQHPNDQLRPAAVTALINIGHPAMIEPLRALLTHQDAEVRLYAALILGRLGQLELLDTLRALAQQDPDPQVREAAEKAVALCEARAREKADLAYLLEKLAALLAVEGLPKLDKIRETLRDLSQHRDPQVLAPLGQLTENRFPSLRRAALQALGNLGMAAARPYIEARLDDESIMVRLAARHALQQLEHTE